jgi:putative flippase GtrA
LEQVRTRPTRAAGLEIGRFLKGQVSSGVATAVDWSLMTVLILVGVHYLIAAAAGAVVGAITDFSVKKWWVFDAAKRGGLEEQAARYALVSAIGAGLNCALSYALVDGLGIHKNIGVIIASTIVGFGWNYPTHRLYVFRRKHKES